MIIELLLDAIYSLFSLLTTPINIPDLPSSLNTYLTQFFDYMEMGATILGNFVSLKYLFTLFGIILAIDVGLKLYHFVMWILKKIPMLGVQ